MLFKFKICYIYLVLCYVYMCVSMHNEIHMWRSENSFWKSILSIHHMDSGDPTQIVRFEGKCFICQTISSALMLCFYSKSCSYLYMQMYMHHTLKSVLEPGSDGWLNVSFIPALRKRQADL